MDKQLDKLYSEYSNTLNPSQYNNYNAMWKKFKEYILNNCDMSSGIDYFFEHKFIRDVIIDVGAYYIGTTDKVWCESAIIKYLNFIRDFKKKILDKKFFNSTIAHDQLEDKNIGVQIQNKVKEHYKKSLSPSNANLHVNQYGYNFLIEYIDMIQTKTEFKSYKNFVISIVLRLLLLYGFKRETVLSLKKGENFDKDRRVLIVQAEYGSIELDLPYSLAIDMCKLEEDGPSSIWLFTDEKGERVGTAYFELGRIKKYAQKYSDKMEYVDDQLVRDQFTLDGISKYGVINLLIAGIDTVTVMEITGIKDNVLKYCQQEAMRLMSKGKNGYINSKTRNLIAFNDFQ